MDFNELGVVGRFRRNKPGFFCRLAIDYFEFQLFTSTAFDNAFFRRNGAWPNRVKEELRAFMRCRYVISNGELMRFGRLQFVKRELVSGDERHTYKAEHDYDLRQHSARSVSHHRVKAARLEWQIAMFSAKVNRATLLQICNLILVLIIKNECFLTIFGRL